MDYFAAIEKAMIEAGATRDAAADAVERMMERPAADYCTERADELPVITEMVKAGLSVATAARITLSLVEQFQALTPLHAFAALDLGDDWQFADEIDEDEEMILDIDEDELNDGRKSGEFNFLGFTVSYDFRR